MGICMILAYIVNYEYFAVYHIAKSDKVEIYWTGERMIYTRIIYECQYVLMI